MAGAYSMGQHAREDDAAIVQTFIDAIGIGHQMKEELLDAVTGLSGSGPAYVFLFIEALADGGVKQGIPRHIALELASQTVFGAAKMVLETGLHPGQLKDNVSSPGGTTIEAIHQLEKLGFRNCAISAVEAATLKGKLMGA